MFFNHIFFMLIFKFDKYNLKIIYFEKGKRVYKLTKYSKPVYIASDETATTLKPYQTITHPTG